ncbi:MAG: SoxR reducing system RseC family protein [Caldisericota bacterium]|jgi:sigma-E factor negative regulatory protein RseC|nr:SoxR reducing system RseC family protein [Caldisericota bacterium]
MQNDTGKVISRNGPLVLVHLDPHDGCTSCPIVGLCASGSRGPSVVSVHSSIPVDPGDTVEVAISDSVVLRAALIAYGIPLAAFLVGVVGGQYLSRLIADSATYMPIISLGVGFLMLIPSALVARKLALRTSLSGSVARIIREVVD